MQAERQLKGEQMAVVTHVNDGQHQFKINDFIDLQATIIHQKIA